MIYGFVLLFVSFMCFAVYHAFILPKYERKIFALYKCRDKLALYGMKDPVIQKSYEYQYLMGMLNAEIYLMHDNISFTQYFKNSVEFSVENEKKIEELLKGIQNDEVYLQVFNESYDIFKAYFDNKMKWFVRLFLKPISHILSFLIYVLERTSKLQDQERVKRMESYATGVPRVYERYMKMNSIL